MKTHVDFAALRGFIDVVIDGLAPDAGIDVDRLVKAVKRRDSSRPESYPAIVPFEGDIPQWEADVRKAIVIVLESHTEVTDVCPTTTKGFWKR